MEDELILRSGRRVAVHDRPAQGTKHEVLFGTLQMTGEAVVVKLEGIPGALERECAALRHLASSHVGVPRLIAAEPACLSGRATFCLVMTRQSGEPPTSTDGWRRLGQALGRLAQPTSAPGPLPVVGHQHFGDQHAQQVSELDGRLDAIAAVAPDWSSLICAEMPARGPLVLTHGDPGPGNFLDDGHHGSLIDWEDALIAPRGLDLARVAFIAWLGSGPAGYIATDHRDRARAAVLGYLETVPGGWKPTIEETRWWFTVAGVQFIHHRWQRKGRPGTWQAAADVLRRGLASNLTWP